MCLIFDTISLKKTHKNFAGGVIPMKKTFALLLCIALFATLITGCAPSVNTESEAAPAAESEAPAEQEEAPAEGEPVTLQFVHLMNSPFTESIDRMTDKYTELNPSITFESEVLKADARYTVLSTRIASGETPDIFMSVESGPSMSMWADAAVDLSNETWWDNITPAAIPMVEYEGKRIALPFNTNVWGLLYNKDVFAEVGITEMPTTLSELQAVADQLEAAGITPFGAGFKDAWVGQHLLQHPFGFDIGSYSDINARFAEYNAGTALVTDDTWLPKLMDMYEVVKNNCQENPFNTDSTMQYQMLATGEVGMIIQGDWAEAPARLIDPETNIGIALLPMSEDPADAKIFTQYAARTIFVGKGDHVEQSLDFIEWLASDPWVVEWYNTDFKQLAPINGVAPTGSDIQIVEDGAKLAAVEANVAPWGKTLVPPELFAEFPSIQEDFLLDTKTKEEVVQEISDKWQEYAANNS